MGFQKIIHISDIHIRAGDSKVSRYDEYITQIDRLLTALEDYDETECIVVLTGDIFHEKYHIGPSGQLIAKRLFRGLSRFTTLVIKGNHDYRQDQKDEPDMLKPYFDDSPENLHYLEETDLYQFDNIEFGVVAIEETLNNAAKGGSCARPPFPEPSPKDDTIEYRIALFHGSAGGAILQNGTNVDDRGDNISVRGWIPKDYDAILLGDIHVQQVHCAKPAEGTEFLDRTKKTAYVSGHYKIDPNMSPWGYSGSLIQQNMGESLWGHGFIVWDLENQEVTAYHLKNTYGKVSVSLDDKEQPCVKIRIGRKLYPLSIKTATSLGWFPTSIHLRFNMNVKHCVQDIQSQFEEAGIVILGTGFMDEAITETTNTAASPTVETKTLIVNDLSSLNSPQEWSKFFSETINLPDGEWSQWLQSPNLMVVPTNYFPTEAELKIKDRNSKFIKLTDAYFTERDMQPPTRRFRIHYLEFSWLLCFGQMNYINFDEFIKQVCLINGNNGSGKSSLLEIIAVSIYGESFPSRSAKSFTASIINQHIPKTDTAYSKICFSIDGTKYWIHRTYDTQPNGNEKSLWQRIIRLLDNTGEILKERANSVDPWIEEHIGVYKHFLLTTIMSQFNDNDFFALPPKDQKTIIDSLLHLNVCETFRLLLKEAQKNHDYALSQLTTYEAGLLSSNTKFESHYANETELTTKLAEESEQIQALRKLGEDLNAARAELVNFSEKAFQQPLEDYQAQKAKLEQLLSNPIQGSSQTLKETRSELRNRLAVLKSKKYPATTLVKDYSEEKPFDDLEAQLNELRIERIKYGSKQRLYDSTSHKEWQKRYDVWFAANGQKESQETSVKLKAQLLKTRQAFDDFELDETEFKPIDLQTLQALEQTHTTLSAKLLQKEHEVKLKTKELVSLVPTEEDQALLDAYKVALTTLTEAFACDFPTATERIMAAQQVNLTITHLETELTSVEQELETVGKVRYEPKDCTACAENPYRHQKINLLKRQQQLSHDIKEGKSKIVEILQSTTPYQELRYIYDTVYKLTNASSSRLIDNERRYKDLNKVLKQEKQQFQKLKEEHEANDYETQQMVYEYYDLKAKLTDLEQQLTAATFIEMNQEYTLAKAVSELEQEIASVEQKCKLAYSYELSVCEQQLKQVEGLLADHEAQATATETLNHVLGIITAYPHYLQAKTLTQTYSANERALATLSAYIKQQQLLREKLDMGKSETEKVSQFRMYLSERSKVVNTMSNAFEQFTDQLYPQKVGPSIENAVNTVLNSISLPRPIKLKAVWESGSFSWHLEDGISSPPYEKCAGAHRFFVGLAIRIAFSRMGASNMVNSQFFLDEGFTACDAETMERVPQLLKNLLKDLDYMQTIFIVSHLDTLKTAADESIMITRGAQASQLKVGLRLDCPKGHAKRLEVEEGGKKKGRPKKILSE